MESASRAAHPALRHVVSGYSGYRFRGGTIAAARRLIPDRSITLVISLANPLRVLDGSAPSAVCARAPVHGLRMAPLLIANDLQQYAFELRLHPMALPALFGLPAAEITGAVVDLADLPVPLAGSLPERLAAQPDWDAQFDVLDTCLLTALREHQVVPELAWSWRRIVHTRGKVGIEQLATEIGWSRRYLTRRFRNEVGLGPKQLSRLVRFEHCAGMLRATPGGPISDIAAAGGYSDHAHMSNEWRALAGCAPTEYLGMLTGSCGGPAEIA
ncbi:helix-turn-helix domain-containing protein [Nocardia arthritidis]|nr:helix-turn-helix domain-containing protein [Nocardia arthritidis]